MNVQDQKIKVDVEVDFSNSPTLQAIRERYGDQAAEIFETGMMVGFSLANDAIQLGSKLSRKATETGHFVFETSVMTAAFSKVPAPGPQPGQEASQSEG